MSSTTVSMGHTKILPGYRQRMRSIKGEVWRRGGEILSLWRATVSRTMVPEVTSVLQAWCPSQETWPDPSWKRVNPL
uniref:Uncharacterized protein n=1 Tax=Setaria viridis TaxID=4556 RepID=A0A4V6DCI5_SETVI|nr:hypothetical protein SEVIR_1G079001v2 [Setaria viridis]